jgi:hypothetical protein
VRALEMLIGVKNHFVKTSFRKAGLKRIQSDKKKRRRAAKRAFASENKGGLL